MSIFKLANLTEEELQKIRKLEHDLMLGRGAPIFLVAYEQKFYEGIGDWKESIRRVSSSRTPESAINTP